MHKLLKKIVSLLLFFSIPFISWADGKPLWEIHAGIVGINSPDYRGSNSNNTDIFPFPALIYRGKRLKASDGKVQGFLYTSETVKFDISLAGSLPASPGDNSARKGMPPIDTTFEVGPSLITRLWKSQNKYSSVSLELPLRAAFSTSLDDVDLKRRGWTFAPFVSMKHTYNNWKGELAFGPTFATSRYHSYFYDVPTQFATSTRPAYNAGSGYSGSRITLSIDKHFKKLSIIGFMRYDALSNATFIDSPLIERSDSLTAGLVVMWQLAKSKRLSSETDH